MITLEDTRLMTRRLALLGAFFLLAGLALLWISLKGHGAPSQLGASAVDLLVDTSAFPRGWFVQGGPISAHDNFHILDHEGARDYASVGFAPPGAKFPYEVTASHTIWDFDNSLYATIVYYTRFRRVDPTDPEILRAWSYRTKVANRFRLDCMYRGGRPRCVATAQYGSIISVFSTPLESACGITTEELERILQLIDERMARYLKDRAQGPR